MIGWLAGAITFGLVAGLMPWQEGNEQRAQEDRSFNRNEVVFKLQDENGTEVVGSDGVGNLDMEVTITVDFPNEDVKVIITNVAELYGLNVVMPEDLKGRTTLKLKDVTWKQVFDVTLDPLGYGYHIDGKTASIASVDQVLAAAHRVAGDDAMVTSLSVSPELNNAGFIKLKIDSEFS